jgi:hypothetical protein
MEYSYNGISLKSLERIYRPVFKPVYKMYKIIERMTQERPEYDVCLIKREKMQYQFVKYTHK